LDLHYSKDAEGIRLEVKAPGDASRIIDFHPGYHGGSVPFEWTNETARGWPLNSTPRTFARKLTAG